MHDLLENGLWDGPEVGVTLTRSGKLLFSESPAKTAAIADQVIASINEHVAAAAGQPTTVSIPIPELGLTAMLHPPLPLTGPGMRVTYEWLLTPEEWEYHWSMAALQTKDPIENKGRKTYVLSSILVLDVSRLGYAGQMPAGPWTGKFQDVLDACDLGNLGGVLVVRSQLTSEHVEALCWRGTPPWRWPRERCCSAARSPARPEPGLPSSTPIAATGSPAAGVHPIVD